MQFLVAYSSLQIRISHFDETFLTLVGSTCVCVLGTLRFREDALSHIHLPPFRDPFQKSCWERCVPTLPELRIREDLHFRTDDLSKMKPLEIWNFEAFELLNFVILKS